MTDPDSFYHAGSRMLQRSRGTERLADHIATKYVHGRLQPEHVEWITEADVVFVATADANGRPDCSYKGGLPGFIRIPDPGTLEIPSYDGNGMFRSLGNVAVTRAIGLLFLFPRRAVKLRVNGDADLLVDPAAVTGHVGADAVLRVRTREVFENCPRYLHDPVTGAHSVHCPRPDYTPPDPAWKLKPEYDGL
jgi:hypothetical protein